MRALGDRILWAATGGLLALGFVGAASIGIFALPFGVVLAVGLTLRATPGAPAVGIGVGVVLLVIGLLTFGDSTPVCTPAGTSDPPAPGGSSTCREGGIGAWAFIAAGIAAFMLAGVLEALDRIRRRTPAGPVVRPG